MLLMTTTLSENNQVEGVSIKRSSLALQNNFLEGLNTYQADTGIFVSDYLNIGASEFYDIDVDEVTGAFDTSIDDETNEMMNYYMYNNYNMNLMKSFNQDMSFMNTLTRPTKLHVNKVNLQPKFKKVKKLRKAKKRSSFNSFPISLSFTDRFFQNKNFRKILRQDRRIGY